MVEPDPDELILNCYRLADWYHQNPDLFLSMPISRIDDHLHYTAKLIDAKQRAQARDSDDD